VTTRLLLLLCLLIPAFAADKLFDDPVVAKAKTFQIRESDVAEAYAAQKAAAAALGQPPPPQLENRMKRQILEKMIANKLLLARATPIDKEGGRVLAQKLIRDNREKAGSEATYRRRLLAVGSSPEKYEAEILEQATVQSVIDRELKDKVAVSSADIRKFYNENSEAFREPEKARVSHMLFASRAIPSGQPLGPAERQLKRTAAERALARARAGEDFAKLVMELTEDPEAKKSNGELTFTRGSGAVPPQFEAAVFSLEPGKVSDVVITVFGYHVIKVLEKIPAGMVPLEKVEDRIRERIQRLETQKQLPEFIDKLRADAGVEVLAKD
jgi:peptidyl-prolyl cis-trans isomerase C